MAENIKVVIRFWDNEDPSEKRGEWSFPSPVSVVAEKREPLSFDFVLTKDCDQEDMY